MPSGRSRSPPPNVGLHAIYSASLDGPPLALLECMIRELTAPHLFLGGCYRKARTNFVALRGGLCLQSHVEGSSWDFVRVVRLRQLEAVRGRATYIACRFGYRNTQVQGPTAVEEHERFQSPDLEQALAFAAQFEPDFRGFDVRELDARHHFYSLDLAGAYEAGLSSSATKALFSGAVVEGRRRDEYGGTVRIRLRWEKHADPHLADPKDDRPHYFVTVLKGPPHGLPVKVAASSPLSSVREAVSFARVYVPEVGAWRGPQPRLRIVR